VSPEAIIKRHNPSPQKATEDEGEPPLLGAGKILVCDGEVNISLLANYCIIVTIKYENST